MVCTVCGFSFQNGNVCPACGSDIEPPDPTEKEEDDAEQATSEDVIIGAPESEDRIVVEPDSELHVSISIPFGIEDAPVPALYESVPFGIGHAPNVDR